MRITQLELRNFRGVSDTSLTLHKNLNVFYGVNGAGKSTILDAVAILLSWIANRIKTPNATARNISEIDIRNGKNYSRIYLEGVYQDQDFYVRILKSRRGMMLPNGEKTGFKLKDFLSKIYDQVQQGGYCCLPLLAYYPVHRAVLDIPLRIKTKHEFGIFDIYEGSLTSAANFRTFFEWYRNREDIENENIKIKLRLSEKYIDSQLSAVRSAISKFLPHFKDLSVYRSPLRMEVVKDGFKLRVDQLSDGEKCLMAMIGDIARRLAIANPDCENPLESNGIVLIDEIDLHVHPVWQHDIIPQLTATFPNCQFIISTHSPHVLTHVLPEQLFFLQMVNGELKVEHPRESYGKNVEQILRNNMGLQTTRPESVTKELDVIYRLIDLGRLDDAKGKIEDVRLSIGNDPELVRSSALIKRKEVIGK
ncbi:MAG: AAA family ATPase [Planctomycetaceae bacterium]|jgi:predicted ATP-binding protein involved in virulence|nr:AAA family ATPase [Planctomycetaceae bacterium]